MSRRGLPSGVRRRHGRRCPAATDPQAGCRDEAGCGYQVQAGPRDARKTKTFDTLRDAALWRDAVSARYAWRRGRRAPTIEEIGEEWLEAAEAGRALSNRGQSYRPSTLRGYRRELRGRVYAELGSRRLDDVSRGDVLALIGGLQRARLEPSTVRNVIVPLRALYRYAADHHWTTANPTRGVAIGGLSGARRERLATAAEAKQLLSALEEGDRALWATAFFAGLRRGELMGLRWVDVDLDAKELRVRRAFDLVAREMGAPKTTASRRTVAFPEVLAAHLRRHFLARPSEDEQALVFARGALGGTCRPTLAAEPFRDTAVARRAKAAWASAGLAPVGLHEAP